MEFKTDISIEKYFRDNMIQILGDNLNPNLTEKERDDLLNKIIFKSGITDYDMMMDIENAVYSEYENESDDIKSDPTNIYNRYVKEFTPEEIQDLAANIRMDMDYEQTNIEIIEAVNRAF